MSDFRCAECRELDAVHCSACQPRTSSATAVYFRACCPMCDLSAGHDGEHRFFAGSGGDPDRLLAEDTPPSTRKETL